MCIKLLDNINIIMSLLLKNTDFRFGPPTAPPPPPPPSYIHNEMSQ